VPSPESAQAVARVRVDFFAPELRKSTLTPISEPDPFFCTGLNEPDPISEMNLTPFP
jgi:hypothetical protein